MPVLMHYKPDSEYYRWSGNSWRSDIFRNSNSACIQYHRIHFSLQPSSFSDLTSLCQLRTTLYSGPQYLSFNCIHIINISTSFPKAPVAIIILVASQAWRPRLGDRNSKQLKTRSSAEALLLRHIIKIQIQNSLSPNHCLNRPRYKIF